MDRFAYLAMSSGDIWIFDDLNQTDLPIGTANLVANQQDYEFADEVLIVNKVLVKTAATGNYIELEARNIIDDDISNIFTAASNNTGVPTAYWKFGHSLLLDPIPSYNSTDGLKVVFQRNVVKFVSTDTTTDPGIPEIFHPYIARYAALPFLIEKNLQHKNDIAALIQVDEMAIKKYFGIRNADEKNKMRPKVENCR